MSAPYREVSSRLKRLLTEGRVIEGSLYRSDRGNTPRHQLSDRATGRFRNIYVPADFAEDVAAWSANWAEAKRLLKEMSEIARAELVEAITARTGRRTVAKPGRGAQGSASGGPSGGLSCPEQAVPQGLVAQNRLQMSVAARRSRDARGHL